MNRQQLFTIGGYVLVFALGAVSGGSAVHAQAARNDATIFDEKGGGRHRLYVWSLEKKLGLSPEQRARVEAVLTSHDGEREAITSEVEPRLKDHRGAAGRVRRDHAALRREPRA
jgi:hypothetical protein